MKQTSKTKVYLHRFLCLLLTACLVFGAAPSVLPSFAAEIVDSGTCGVDGNNLTWELNDEGVLTISGNGKMQDYNGWNSPFFQLSRSIRTVRIENGVNSIGASVFDKCQNINTVSLPDSITEINAYAFADCNGLTSITLPPYVTSVNNGVFFRCENLETVILPSAVTSIGDYAFQDCEKLPALIIPDSVTSIGQQAFSGCTSLTSLHIPENVIFIGGGVFSDNVNMSNITISADNTHYHIDGNCLIETDSRTLISGCGKSVIPADGSVTDIGPYAFYCCNGLIDLTIPDYVNSIGTMAFAYCYNLSNVIIGDGVTTIGNRAFYYSKVDHLTLGNNVAVLETGAFEHCTGLTCVTIPDSVTDIEIEAFCFCENLSSLTVGKGVNKISGSGYIVSGCDNLTTLNVAVGNTTYHSDGNCIIQTSNNSLVAGCKTSVIPEYVSSLGTYSFGCFNSLTEINIPENVTSIGASAFYNCQNLTSVSIPYKVRIINYYAFQNCISLSSVVLPFNVQFVGGSAFSGCSSLRRIYVYNRNCSIVGNALPKTTVIYGYAGSTAQTYANENGIQFVAMDENHNHPDDMITELESIDILPTCGKGGQKTITVFCKLCGETINETTEAIAPTGNHIAGDPFDTIRSAPTCIAEGEKIVTIKCTVCDATLSENTVSISPTGHVNTIDIAATDSTCIAHGYTAGVYCNDCKKYISGHEEKPLAIHAWNAGIVTTPATCSAKGVITFTCTVAGCGATRTDDISIDESNHINTKNVAATDSTCIAKGYTAGVYCNDCKKYISGHEEKPLTGHEWDGGVVISPATCSGKGVKTFTCTVEGCGVTRTETLAIDPANHAYGEWKVIKLPTCQETGLEQRVCANNSAHVETNVIPKTDHTDKNHDGKCDVCRTDVCRFCGKIHPNTCLGKITKFIHEVAYFFAHLFGKM